MNNPDPGQIYRQLLTGPQSLILATLNANGSPLVSYSPFVVDDHKQFFIFTSGLAAHTANLRQNRTVSLMLIEDESAARQIFARQRLTFQCRVEPIARAAPEWVAAQAMYQARFGKMADLITGLPDFELFRLTPHAGQLVTGFGQAYDLTGDALDTLSHRES